MNAPPLRRGWTTGACAAAAAKAAYSALLTGEFPDPVEVTLPKGQRPSFALAGEFKPRLRPGEGQHAMIDERVVHDDVGLGEARERIERQQPGISRASSGQPDMPRL